MGFKPQGENFSLKPVKGRTQGATRMDELIKELNIDKSRIIGVSHKSAARNVKMMTTTALLCVFSIALYIYLFKSECQHKYVLLEVSSQPRSFNYSFNYG